MNKIMCKAYAEVDEFLAVIKEDYSNKVPIKLRKFFKAQKNRNHKNNIDFSIEEGRILDETLTIIALLNLKYWVDDEEEYNRLVGIYKTNELMYRT